MDWQANLDFDGTGYGGYYGTMDGSQRPHFATNPQDILSYDDGPGMANGWSNNSQEPFRPLEERISGRPQDLNLLAHQQNHSFYGMVGLPANLLGSAAYMNPTYQGEQMGNHQVQVPGMIPGISMREPSPKPQSPGTFASTKNQNNALSVANGSMSQQARLEKAADLRAKLKASLAMRSGGTTPGRDMEPKDKTDVNDSKRAVTHSPNPTANTQPQVMNDIEGLFAEARAAAEAKDVANPEEARVVHNKSANHKVQNTIAKSTTKRPTAPEKKETVSSKKSPLGPSKEVKQTHNESGGSSETSELGEIHESTAQQPRSKALEVGDGKKEMQPKVEKNNVLPKAIPPEKNRDSQRDDRAGGGSGNNGNDRKTADPTRVTRHSAIDTRSGADQTENARHDSRMEQPRRSTTDQPKQSNGETDSPPPSKKIIKPSNDVDLVAHPSPSRPPRQPVATNDIDERRHLDVLPAQSDLSPVETPNYIDVQSHKEISSGAGSDHDDLDDWLEMTGYHDQTYRKRALRRHRELIALEMQKAVLEREAQLEHEERVSFARAQSIIPHDGLESSLPRSNFQFGSVKALSRVSMPPPPLPVRTDLDTRGQSKPVRSASVHLSTVDSIANDEHHAHYPQTPSSSSHKRRLSNSDSAYREQEPAKHARTESGDHIDTHGSIRLEKKSLISPNKVQNIRTGEEERPQWRHTSRNDKDDDVTTRQRPRGPKGKASPPMIDLDRQRSRSPSPLPPRMPERYDRNDHRRLSGEDSRYARQQSPTRRVMGSRDSSPSYGRSYESRAPPRSASYGYSERVDYRDDYVQRKFSDEPVRGSFQQPVGKYYHSSESTRGRGRGRGASFYSRGGGRINKFARQEHKGVDSLDLRTGGQY